jgi:Tol biopolymer transport system component
MMAISPDGRSVVFVAVDSVGQRSIWLRRLDGTKAIPLLRFGMHSTGQMAALCWSPDSRHVLTLNAEHHVLAMPVDGGPPTEVCISGVARGGAWSRKGVIVFARSTQSGLYQVPARGGDPVQVTWPDSSLHESGHRFPCFLPDGEHFLYVSMPPGPQGYDIYSGALRSRERKKILTAESAVTYVAPGYLLFRRSGHLTAQRFDANRLQLVGEPIQLADAPPPTDLDAEPIATASDDGKLLVLANPPVDSQLSWVDRTGATRGTLSLPPGPWGDAVLSPDDRYAIVSNGDDLWRIEVARSNPLRLTSGGGFHAAPVWSPDGSQIAYTTGGQGAERIDVQSSDGSGSPHVFPTTDDLFKSASDWCREGLILFAIRNATFQDVLLARYPQGGITALAATAFSENTGKVSPDGHWLAYLSNEAGDPDLYVQSFPEPGHKVRVTSGGVTSLWWMPGSDEICYRSASGTEIMSVKLARRGADLDVGSPRLLFRLSPDVDGATFAHDGQRMLVTTSQGGVARAFADRSDDRSGDGRCMRMIVDWTAMLGR